MTDPSTTTSPLLALRICVRSGQGTEVAEPVRVNRGAPDGGRATEDGGRKSSAALSEVEESYAAGVRLPKVIYFITEMLFAKYH